MISCPVCLSSVIKKNGSVIKTVMRKGGKRNVSVQKYRCSNMHVFRVGNPPFFDDSFIEQVVYVYLRCLSLNTTIDIIREMYEQDVLSKQIILDFIEIVADRLPTLSEIDDLYEPKRSGFVALDGVWFSYNDEEIVLLVAFDPVSFDIIAANFEKDETEEGYTKLISEVIQKLGALEIKGAYGDGDNSLILSLKKLLPHVPFQLCIVHKEIRMGTLMSIIRQSGLPRSEFESS